MKLTHMTPPYVLVRFAHALDNAISPDRRDTRVFVQGFEIMEAGEWLHYMASAVESMTEVANATGMYQPLVVSDRRSGVSVTFHTPEDFENSFEPMPITADEAQVLVLTFDLKPNQPFGFFPRPDLNTYLKEHTR